jgi:hypothetical protein
MFPAEIDGSENSSNTLIPTIDTNIGVLTESPVSDMIGASKIPNNAVPSVNGGWKAVGLMP